MTCTEIIRNKNMMYTQMTKCANCYYGETKVTICDGDGVGN